MRWVLYLVPSLFFLASFMALDGIRELPMAQLRAEASVISGEMNQVSGELSKMVQEVNLGQSEYADVEEHIDLANLRLEELKAVINGIWEDLDQKEVQAARDQVLRRALRISGIISAVIGFAAIAGKNRGLSPHCLLATGVIMLSSVI